MGCSASNQHPCKSDEFPIHEVSLTHPFYMGRFEVTQAQWTSRMGSNPSRFRYSSPQVPPELVPFRPVENVYWDTLPAFLGVTAMRLPTEAEWEFAYRAGTTTAFHGFSGCEDGTNDDTLIETIAWVNPVFASTTHPVGLKAANGFGLHDMAGNVWEWVSDWYSPSYYSSSPSVNPPGPVSGSIRLLRGGSWISGPSECRASDRTITTPSGYDGLVGFRVARNP